MIGPEVYKMLVAQLERPIPLPHPVMRRANKKTPDGRVKVPNTTTPVQG